MALRKCFSQDADFKERMYAKQMAVMKGQAWNVVETLKTPDHGPLELTRRARVCVWDDLVEIPIAVPMRAPSSEMRRKREQAEHRYRSAPQHEEMDITALSTPQQKPQTDLLLNSPPLELAHENPFNNSRQNSSNNVRHSEEDGPQSPATVSGMPWTSRLVPDRDARSRNGRPAHHPRKSYDSPGRKREQNYRDRRYSLNVKRRQDSGALSDDEGDLGYAANEDLDGNSKTVIVERLEMVKAKNPVFTWC